MHHPCCYFSTSRIHSLQVSSVRYRSYYIIRRRWSKWHNYGEDAGPGRSAEVRRPTSGPWPSRHRLSRRPRRGHRPHLRLLTAITTPRTTYRTATGSGKHGSRARGSRDASPTIGSSGRQKRREPKRRRAGQAAREVGGGPSVSSRVYLEALKPILVSLVRST
ncbi:uncharacterized protein LY79DRAFT_222829 [Colletotrichum navitas]|uniref:Uncharacterized protein n=1 Tax=Colletotrichum navitas TaxID=681940 RepID=A0AAD8V483_9PEZI|nr:uncharacterized protein LY79DRAFT_222829 [Colletotrichum navitas]KAK1590132.1 hypothetical protein LY79DRAFT_222829 [Colletotrichum navitas]